MKAMKAWAALGVGVVADAITLGLVPHRWLPYALFVISGATALGVYRAPKNKVTEPPA